MIDLTKASRYSCPVPQLDAGTLANQTDHEAFMQAFLQRMMFRKWFAKQVKAAAVIAEHKRATEAYNALMLELGAPAQ